MKKSSHTQITKISSQVLQIYNAKGIKEFKENFKKSLYYISDYCNNDLKELNKQISSLVSCILTHLFPENKDEVLKVFAEIIHQSLVCHSEKGKIDAIVNDLGDFLEKNSENDISLGKKVKKYLKKCSNKELRIMTADSLSETFAYSRSSFFKMLKEDYNKTPAEMILYEKLNRTFDLVKEGCFEEKICKIFGFGKPETFRNAFKKQFGFLPSEVSDK